MECLEQTFGTKAKLVLEEKREGNMDGSKRENTEGKWKENGWNMYAVNGTGNYGS